MTLQFCDLGQALLSRTKKWEFLPVAQFKNLRKPNDLPADRASREGLLISLMNSELPHTGTLVVMDHDYTVDEDGKDERQEVELEKLCDDYSASEKDWDYERTNFYGSFLDFTNAPAGYKIPPGIDAPWIRLKDIRVPIDKLKTLSSTTKPGDFGGRPPSKNWDAFWMELVCQFYLEGRLKDDDDDWKELNRALRKEFTDRDDSAMRQKTRELRQVLRERQYIKPTGK